MSMAEMFFVSTVRINIYLEAEIEILFRGGLTPPV
jgi:hypothetical protein